MSNTKTEFKFFTIAQYRQEEQYLTTMHEKGWKLKKAVFPGFYQFEKCEPAKGTYRLDYNPEGVKNKAEYVQLFSDCGWNYLFDYVGYSYFFKEGDNDSDNEEIFSDDASRLDMMKRVLKGRVLPLILIFVCVIMPQLFMNTRGYGHGGNVQEVLSGVFFALAMLYLVVFALMTVQFYQYEKLVLPEKSSIIYKYSAIGMFLVLLAVVLCYLVL